MTRPNRSNASLSEALDALLAANEKSSKGTNRYSPDRGHYNTCYSTSDILNDVYPEWRRERWSVLGDTKLQSIFECSRPCESEFTCIDQPTAIMVDEWKEASMQHQLALESNDRNAQKKAARILYDVEQSLIFYPSHTVFGILCKMMIWREKAHDQIKGLKENSAIALAYSAYGDILRLTRLRTLAVQKDFEFDLISRDGIRW